MLRTGAHLLSLLSQDFSPRLVVEGHFLSHIPLPVQVLCIGPCRVACHHWSRSECEKVNYIHNPCEMEARNLVALKPRWLWLHPLVLLFTGSSPLHWDTEVPRRILTMETSCFLTSKPSPKTMAVAGVTKPKLHLLFGNRRAGSSVSCCNYNPRSSEDGVAPAIDPDWRSYRAQLYFNEQYAKRVNPAATTVPPEPVKIGDKWAHPLVEPEKGCLLIATEKLDRSHIFERTVILLLSAGVLGPVGVILNRPSLMSIKEAQSIFADDADITGAFSGRPLFFGGPLEECFFLLGPRVAAGDVVARTGLFEEVMPGLHYGTRESVGCAAELAKRGVVGVRDFRFFDGFCGWEREQLRDEVRGGLWRVAACSPAVLGLASVVKGGLWEEVQGLVRERRVW